MDEEIIEVPPKRKRGRPRKPVQVESGITPITKADYSHADIDTLVDRQLSIVDMAQTAIRDEIATSGLKPGKYVTMDTVDRINGVSGALVKAIEAMKRAAAISEELEKKLSPDEVTERAISRIEVQDRETLVKIIKRLIRVRKNADRSKSTLETPIADVIAGLV